MKHPGLPLLKYKAFNKLANIAAAVAATTAAGSLSLCRAFATKVAGSTKTIYISLPFWFFSNFRLI